MNKTANLLDIVGLPQVYKTVTDCWNRPQFAVRGHDGIALLLEGKIEYHFAAGSVVASAGDVVVLPGNTPYSGTRLTDGTAGFIVIDFDCTDPTAFAALALPTVINAERRSGVRQLFSEILAGAEGWQRADPFKVKGAVYRLIGELMEACASPLSDTTEEILRHITKNLTDPELRVADLCRRFFISESQLRRNIQRMTGMNPTAYIMELRLTRAAAELRWSDRSVKEIALSAGFADPYYFSKCFSHRFSLPPTAYRKKFGESR